VQRKKLITVTDVEVLFELSRDQTRSLVAERGFPDPVTHIGRTPLWMRGQVDASSSSREIIDYLAHDGAIAGPPA
jgi:hypothetical protein